MTQPVKNHRGKNTHSPTELMRASKAPIDKCNWAYRKSLSKASGLHQDKRDAIRARVGQRQLDHALGAKLDQLLGRADWVPPFSDSEYWGTR
jgi:hypothetical protein